MCIDMIKQECKVFIGGLSWETTGEKLRAYFENHGAVREAFVSYNRCAVVGAFAWSRVTCSLLGAIHDRRASRLG